MKQKVITPPIEDCFCGAKAKPIEDWDFRNQYRIICDNNHTLTKDCKSIHRAICLWNNRVKVKKSEK